MIDLAIGLGQGGSRIAKEFSEVFKAPGRYINFADVDYANFDVPKSHYLVLDGSGTGRDPDVGERLADDHEDDICTFVEDAAEATRAERVVVCIGGGGGSGAGMMFTVIEHLIKLELEVLVVYTLPQKSEGLPAKPNALYRLNRLIAGYVAKGIKKSDQTAVLLIDNDFCISRYSASNDEKDYWKSVNRGIVMSLKRMWDLTNLDNIEHLDAAAGFGAMDKNEFLRIVFFKEGFLDIRSIIFESSDASELGKTIKSSSLVFGNLDIGTTKAYIVSLALPSSWKNKSGTRNFIDDVFSRLQKSARTPYVLRSSFFSPRIEQAKCLLILAGMSRSHGLEKILGQTEKDVRKYREKGGVEELDLSNIDL